MNVSDRMFENCHRGRANKASRKVFVTTLVFIEIILTFGLFTPMVSAAPPGATIEYQPMTGHGLAAGHPFEAWVVFDKPSDPTVPGYALPAGATFRFTFPKAFKPRPAGPPPSAVLLYGWPHAPAPVPFTVGLDPKDPRTIVLKLSEAFPTGPPESPGLKAIHLRWGPLNPSRAGNYPITIQVIDAGSLSGASQAIAHITPKPVPNVAAYNTLHDGRNENWQHVKTGQEAALPIDLLVTLPDKARSSISLSPTKDGNFEILSDKLPIGTITRRGVPVTLKPEPFGPGFSRLGLIRYYVTAGPDAGIAQIEAELKGGPRYTINVIVEP
ncbi:MAG TPA: hypothetical protein VK463_03295 [Desulfomonilaceae bacterium]|nr:hypothetical protein [Desulfomonilaceae bacterium]